MTVKRKAIYPSKTTLNLVMKERPENYYPKILCGVLIFAVLIAVFLKFAVVDRLNAANNIWNDVNSAQQSFDALVQEDADYETIRTAYEKNISGGDRVTNAEYVDCMDVISLIETQLMPAAGVSSVKLSGTTLSLVLTGITFEDLYTIYPSLYDSPVVSDVSVSTAVSQDEGAPTVSMTITLKAEGGAVK